MGNKLLCGLVAAALVGAAGAAHAATTTLSGNVPAWVKNATLMRSASASESVVVAVHLTLTDNTGLKKLVAEISDPNSSQYGRYLSTEQFAQRFAASADAVNAATAMLERAGMQNVTVGPDGAFVTANATIAQLRSAFKISQNLYSYKGKTLRANVEEPTVPSELAGRILFIQGLDDTALLRHPLHQSPFRGPSVAPTAKNTTPSVTPPPVAASNPLPYCNTHFGSGALVAKLSTAADVYGAEIPWAGCGYNPGQIREAYGLDRIKVNGAGVTVAIVDAYASPTLLADGNRFAANHHLPTLVLGKNFNQIIPPGIYDVSPGEACIPYGWWEEQSLDMGAVHGSAPGADILYIGARDCNTSLDVALYNALYNHLADVVTNSYGFEGETIAPGEQLADDQAYMAGAAQGITVLFSSGDSGDESQNLGIASGDWPATSSYVTGVGGTSLLLKDSYGTKSEYGWGNYRAFLADAKVNSARSVTTSGVTQISAFGATFDDYEFYAGAGGGISLLEPQPSYQAKTVPYDLATTLNLGSGYTEPLPNAQRVSPDVAMVADPYTGELYGETYTIAGNPLADSGCTPISTTEEYCENSIGGTSLASPLMAGVIAVMNSQRLASGEPLVGFANPLLYSVGSKGNGENFQENAINQIIAPKEPVSVLRGYAANLNEARVVTINSVPFLITTTTPFALQPCALPLCEGVDDVFNFTSLATKTAPFPPTPAGYNDVTGLGVPWVPRLLKAE